MTCPVYSAVYVQCVFQVQTMTRPVYRAVYVQCGSRFRR